MIKLQFLRKIFRTDKSDCDFLQPDWSPKAIICWMLPILSFFFFYLSLSHTLTLFFSHTRTYAGKSGRCVCEWERRERDFPTACVCVSIEFDYSAFQRMTQVKGLTLIDLELIDGHIEPFISHKLTCAVYPMGLLLTKT